MRLRDYQRDCNTRTVEALEAHGSALVVMPTGTGKTVTFADLINSRSDKGRTLIMAHRDELIRQAVNKIRLVTGEEPIVEMAEQRADDAHGVVNWIEGFDPYDHNVRKPRFVVTSVQTQNAPLKNGGRRMERLNPDEFGTIIIDEAHHATAQSYRRVVEYYLGINPDIKVIGYTATPDRTDEMALGKVFDVIAYDMEIVEAIELGWLVPIEQHFVEVDELDFSKVRTTAGDLNQRDLAAVMEYEEILHEVAVPSREIAKGRQTLIFAASVHQAKRLCEILNRYEPDSARFVYQHTPKLDRRQIIMDYKHGQFQFLVNCMIATEGFDCPGVEVIVMARPTKSRSLYAQMAGRATRPADQIVDALGACEKPEARRELIAASRKPKMTIIDFVGNSGRHKLVCTAEILGGRYEDDVIQRAVEIAKEADGPVNMQLILPQAQQQIEEEEEARRKKIKGTAKYRTSKISPFSLFNLRPRREREWNRNKPATDKMTGFLRRAGVEDVDQMTFAECSTVIGELMDRREKNLCSFKQGKVLNRFGYDPKEVTFTKAGELITAIAANDWARPKEG